MRETRANNDNLKAAYYNNCVTNIPSASTQGGYRIDFSKPMSSIIRLDIAKMLKQRFNPQAVTAISIKQLLQVISDFNEY